MLHSFTNDRVVGTWNMKKIFMDGSHVRDHEIMNGESASFFEHLNITNMPRHDPFISIYVYISNYIPLIYVYKTIINTEPTIYGAFLKWGGTRVVFLLILSN